ncbi:MAG TPA: MBL fold metallo-hydrolase, partial [Chlamydiales bacterium]|nr:MBL fold metallo-hydrolase [Chlamydiales bacterium]
HSHWDHIVDVMVLKEKTGASLWVHRLDAGNVERPGSDQLPLPFVVSGVKPDHLLEDGDLVQVGNLQLEVIHTPGHSPGSICYYIRDHNLLFSGDTLFFAAIGRTDLPTGSPETIWDSLKKLAELPPETKVIPGHGPETSIGKEL